MIKDTPIDYKTQKVGVYVCRESKCSLCPAPPLTDALNEYCSIAKRAKLEPTMLSGHIYT